MLSKKYFEKEVNELNKYVDGVDFLNKGVENQFIEEVERKLNVLLPLEYKEFLKIYNGGELFRPGTVLSEIYRKQEDKVRGLYYLNDVLDENCHIMGMPDHLIFIATMNYGDKICIDLNQSTEYAYLVQWDIQTGEITREWTNFKEWLDDSLEVGEMLYDYDGTEVE